VDPREDGPCEQQDRERDGEVHRAEDAGFDLPPVVDDSGDCSEIDELVQAVPLLAAEFADGPRGGCSRERNQKRVGGESGDDEAALRDVGLEDVPIEVEVEDKVCCEVNTRIEEGEEAEETAELDDAGESRRE